MYICIDIFFFSQARVRLVRPGAGAPLQGGRHTPSYKENTCFGFTFRGDPIKQFGVESVRLCAPQRPPRTWSPQLKIRRFIGTARVHDMQPFIQTCAHIYIYIYIYIYTYICKTTDTRVYVCFWEIPIAACNCTGMQRLSGSAPISTEPSTLKHYATPSSRDANYTSNIPCAR